MKTKLVLGAVAAAIAVFSQGAFAQAASSPSRADVKADAKKNRTPAGEATGSVTPSKSSDKTQEARKARPRPTRKPATEAGRRRSRRAAAGQGQPGARARRPTAPRARPKPRKPSRRARPLRPARAPTRRRSKSCPGAARSASTAEGDSAESPFLLAVAVRSSTRAPGGRRAPRPPRFLLVELEQPARLEQLGERGVAVIARVERSLVAERVGVCALQAHQLERRILQRLPDGWEWHLADEERRWD